MEPPPAALPSSREVPVHAVTPGAKEEALWLLTWFRKRNGRLEGPFEEQLKVDYFKAGWIDSLGVIELITGVEHHFGIRFEAHHFQERRFSTIAGLSELIEELCRKRK